MQNYTQNGTKCQINSILKIASNSDISDIFGNLVPYPHLHYFDHSINRKVYGWYLDGFFETKKNTKYINDLIARFIISCDCKLHSLQKIEDTENLTPLNLNAFKGLKSLPKDSFKRDSVKSLINGDYIYTCIVLQAEKFIKNNGIIVYSALEEWAFENFIDISKDKATLKAKCNNCWHWYLDRNWELYHTVRIKKNVEEVMATRVEHANKLSMKNEEIAKQKIYNSQRLIKYFGNQDGKLSLRAIERDSGCSINTVRKHFISWDKI